jgi:hypothetical protein
LAALTENGYDATNMDHIAARAGVGKPLSTGDDWSLVADVVLAMGLLQVVQSAIRRRQIRATGHRHASPARGADAAHRGAQALTSN